MGASILGELVAVFALGGAVGGLFRARPRLGPGRAVSIALRSYLKPLQGPASIRTQEVAGLRKYLDSASCRGSYAVLTGEEGIGKTAVLNTAAHGSPSLVRARFYLNSVLAGKSTNRCQQITDMVLSSVANTDGQRKPWRDIDHVSVLRIVRWHKFLFGGRAPTVVLKADAVENADFDVRDAGMVLFLVAKRLQEEYGLGVVVDSTSPKLCAELAKWNPNVIHVGPLTKGEMQSLPNLQSLHALLDATELGDFVYAELGGNPQSYSTLDVGLHGELLVQFGYKDYEELIKMIKAADDAGPAAAATADHTTTKRSLPVQGWLSGPRLKAAVRKTITERVVRH